MSKVSKQCALQAGYKEDGHPERRDGNVRDSKVIAVSSALIRHMLRPVVLYPNKVYFF